MGTYSAYKKLYQKVAADMPPFRGPGTLEEYALALETAKANTDRCITTVREHSGNAILMDLFNLAFPGAPTMPTFSGRERAQRRQRSNALRDAMLSDIAYRSNIEKKYGVNLPYQSLLYPEMYRKGNSGAKDNEYILSLFAPDSETYAQKIEEKVARKLEELPNLNRDKVREEFRSQGKSQGRAVIWDRMANCNEIINQLDKMIDPALSAEQLAENYLKIKSAQRTVEAVDDYIRMGEDGLFALSSDVKNKLNALKPHLPALKAAVKKLELMANPMYEYIDLDSLDIHDMRKLNDFWKEMRATPKFQGAFQRRNAGNDAAVQRYLASGDLMDNFTSFLEDAADYADIRDEIAATRQKEILGNYGFDSDRTTVFAENPNTTTDNSYARNRMQRVGQHHLDDKGPLNLYRNRPVAYEMGYRTVILSPTKSGLGLTTDKPESLYNYTLMGTAASLDKVLEDADRWYKTNKHGYGDMRNQLDKIIKLGNLAENFPVEDLNNRRKLFSDLLNTSEHYLKAKSQNPRENDPVEAARIEAAKKAKHFAEEKLRELEMISAAKDTALRYKDMSPEQLRIRTAAENTSEKMQEKIRESERAERSVNPARWLRQRYSAELAAREGLPDNLSRLMEENLKKVEKAWENDTVFVEAKASADKVPLLSGRSWDRYQIDETQYKSCNELDLALGAVAAAAMIREERKALNMRSGPMEIFFSQMKDEKIAEFGRAVFARLNTSGATKKWQLKDVLIEFDPRNDPNQLGRDYADLQPVFCAQDLTKHYLNTIKSTGDPARDKVFQDFVKNNIILPAMHNGHLDSPLVMERPRRQYDSMMQPIAQLDNETLRKIGADNQELLAACVIHNVIQLERNGNPNPGPGALEQRLADPAAFMKEIKDSYAFTNIVDASRSGKISTQSVLMGQQVSKFAFDYVAHYNDKIRAQNEIEVRPNQNENRVEQQLQKGDERKVPVDAPKKNGRIL